MKGDIIIMKMKKLMAALVVITLLATSVVCSAATYTTRTEYSASTGKVQVITTIDGLAAGSMATYVLYGYPDGYTDYEKTDGVTEVAGDPTETNILYIDQNNSATSSFEFGRGVKLDPKKVMGSKVIVGTDEDTTLTNKSTELLDQGIACFKLALDTTNGVNLADAKISKIDVSFAFPEGETETYTLSSDQNFVYIPAGIDYTLTFNVKPDSVMGTVKIGNDDVSNQIVMNKYKGTSAEDDRDTTKTLVLGKGTDLATSTSYVSIDSNPIFATSGEFKTVAFIINNNLSGYTDTGIDIIAYEKGTTTKVNEVLNLRNLAPEYTAEYTINDPQIYAIRLVDELGKFIDTDKYDYEAVPYYMNGTEKVSLTNYAGSNYYIVNRSDFVEAEN